ncbi:MAG: hypothetical protein CMC55_06760 [Flavobacteriaceae bacterium]|nr:hypothetical protein [Flavobacteriaceae bacterium]|tara:strand:- start:789 stop:1166 length:378 start_codon:yes stop_codon:yes gene_type:complete
MINKVVIGFISVAILILGFSLYITNVKRVAYDKGVSDTITEINKQSDKQIKEQEDKNKVIKEEDHKDEVASVKVITEIKYKTEKVIEYVDREIEVPVGCDKLATDVVYVLSETTSNINKSARRTN